MHHVALRIIGAILTIVVAGWALFTVSPNVGDLTECGTGSYFLAPLAWLAALIQTTILVSVAASATIAVLIPRWSGLGLLALLAVEVGAAAAGTLASEAQHGCDRYRDGSSVGTAVGIVLVIALVIVAIAFVLTLAASDRSAARNAPNVPPGPTSSARSRWSRAMCLGSRPVGPSGSRSTMPTSCASTPTAPSGCVYLAIGSLRMSCRGPPSCGWTTNPWSCGSSPSDAVRPARSWQHWSDRSADRHRRPRRAPIQGWRTYTADVPDAGGARPLIARNSRPSPVRSRPATVAFGSPAAVRGSVHPIPRLRAG